MTTKGRQPWIIGALALVMTGCAGNGSPPFSVSSAAAGDGSWMDPAAIGRNLLYVSDEAANVVDVFTYPYGRSAGVLPQIHDPAGICTTSAGEIWIVNAPNRVLKYGHGGKRPEMTLEDANALRFQACAVNPKTGDLAVTDAGRAGEAGSVVLYSGGKGTPKRYRSDDLSQDFFAAYDSKGNLFVDGLDASYAFRLVELPHGGEKLNTVRLDQSIGFPGALAWDGKYLALGDRLPQGDRSPRIYQISVSGAHGVTIHATRLANSCDLLGFTVPKLGSGKGNPQGTRVVAPDVCDNAVRFYAYPNGGLPKRTLGQIQYPFSAAVSAAAP